MAEGDPPAPAQSSSAVPPAQVPAPGVTPGVEGQSHAPQPFTGGAPAHGTQPATAATAQPGPSSQPPPAPAAAAAHEVNFDPPGIIEAGATTDEEGDDGYGSDGQSSAATSLSTSVRDYAFENSRRYHKFREGRYHFPNDEPEQEREDMRHAMLTHLWDGRLHYAPLENPLRILDVGTGTGVWAIDAGDEYPSARVIGLDLSPIQPVWVPPNVEFVVDDAESNWVYKPNSIDYVHARNMVTAVKNWPKLIGQAFTALKPGGWIEIQDFHWVYMCDDGTMPDDYAPNKMAGYIREGLIKFGIELTDSEKNLQRLGEAGFVNLTKKVDKLPVGPWAKDKTMKTIGLYNRSAIYDGLHGITMGPLTRGLKWTPDEVEVFLIKVRKELMNTSHHTYIQYYSLYAQKPW